MDGTARPIGIKRIYEEASAGDGCRILVDRLWPRGLSKGAAAIDEWMKDIAPSPELRKWFGHAPERFPEFRGRYRAELEEDGARRELSGRILELAAQQPVTLLYAAKDPVHNHAAVLREWLLGR
ncbi:DUF488 domain-containing protein [Paenibacillus tepidiphilus]|uniref:DUF488 domain-containing protein n=1 Tax=Paenibacillus tepidiphilus TaxID=2608683 RepID=UPI00123B06F1|nr:DUF488 domain-containing protein [Paenibacillus tepidiphilus]